MTRYSSKKTDAKTKRNYLFLLALCAFLAWSNVASRGENRILRDTNELLMQEQEAPPPVQDASLTHIYNSDGTVTVIVNGYFIKTLYNVQWCRGM